MSSQAALLHSNLDSGHVSKKQLILVDGSGYIFRAFHALPPLVRSDGTPVGAVLGFTNMLLKLLEDYEDAHFVVIFDAARKNFRNDIYPDYKANREDPPPELIPQFSLIREACKAFNVPSIEMEGYEADDLIATYALKGLESGAEVKIVSSDKDLMQLVEPGVSMYDPMKNKSIGEAEVLEKFGVSPDKVIDVQALAGDKSDNIPGVEGIGIKTAAELINLYGSLEELLERVHEIKQPKRRERLETQSDLARVSKELVTLKKDVPLDFSLEEFERKEFDLSSVQNFLQEQSFKNLLTRLQSKYDFKEVKPATKPVQTNYELVTTKEALEKWVGACADQGYFAIDTETNSLDAMRADLVGISLALAPGKACYIPLNHKIQTEGFDFGEEAKEKIPQLSLSIVVEALKDLLVSPSVLKIGQNIKFDMHVLASVGLSVAPIEDTMVMSYVLEGARHGHSMDELAKLYLDKETISYKEVTTKGKSQITFDYVDLESATNYAAEDADITLQLYTHLRKRLQQEGLLSFYTRIEQKLISVLFKMEEEGILLDPQILKKLSHEFLSQMSVLEQEILELTGESFNIASPKQLGEVLFEKLNLPGGKKGKSGAYSTSADVLETLDTEGHAVAGKIIEWRGLSKLKSTYTDTLTDQINPKTKRVHTSFAMTLTSTGRLSSSNPNLQNIPIRTEDGKKIRRAFISKPGSQLVSLDYSQIELRLLAHVAEMESLRDSFARGEDIHRRTASQVFNLPLEEVDSAHRRKAKAINFGIIYGISAFGLAKQLGIAQKEAAHYIDIYFEQYPGIQDYMEKTKAFAREKGYVETIFGRRCYINDINAKGPGRSFAERQAINAPLQGSAADIIKKAMVGVHNLLLDKTDAKMILQVHDELVFEIEEGKVAQYIPLLKQEMEKVVSLSVPLTVEAGQGKTWEDAH